MDEPGVVTWRDAAEELDLGNPAPELLTQALSYGRHRESKELGVYWLRADLDDILGLINLEGGRHSDEV
jgi:hypothetical protein